MEKTPEIRDYLDIGLRRKWLFIIPVLLISVLVVAYAYKAPKLYRASTLILVEAQKLPTGYVKPTVEEKVDAQLRTITEQIMSRTYLEKIIGELNLYPDLREKLPLESVIEGMRKCITVAVTKGRVFNVSFVDEDPVIAMKGANRLASLFIEENLKVREELAEGTLLFLDRELERIRALLKQQEADVSKFRSKYLGMLPEQLDANLRTLDRLQEQLKNTNQALRAGEENRRLLLQQLVQMRSMSSLSSPQDADSSGTEVAGGSDLFQLEAQLERLRGKYTDKHPEVIRLTKQIARMKGEDGEEGVAAGKREESGVNTSDKGPPELEHPRTVSNPSVSRWQAQIVGQIGRVDVEIARHKAERNRLQGLIREYERRVEGTPKVEQQLKELTRGYEVTQKEYQSLLDKRLQAELAANMERKQKGERFKVLDPAKTPENPFKPNRQRIILVGIMLAMAAGVGLVAVAEHLDTSFYGIEELEEFTDLPVIASIPDITARTQKKAAGKR